MSIGANSYGDTGEIAALVPKYATASTVFDTTTRPTLLQVESLVDQVSAVVNIILAEFGFAVPVSEATAKLALDLFVNEETAALVEGINGIGRFGPTAPDQRGRGRGRYALILDDVRAFIEGQALGLELLGATRTRDNSSGLAFRDTDTSGDSTAPLFQREQFGETYADSDTS